MVNDHPPPYSLRGDCTRSGVIVLYYDDTHVIISSSLPHDLDRSLSSRVHLVSQLVALLLERFIARLHLSRLIIEKRETNIINITLLYSQ